MTWLVFAVGGVLLIGGIAATGYGVEFVGVERSWTLVVAGTAAMSGGVVTIAFGCILMRLDALWRAVAGGPDSFAARRSPAIRQDDLAKAAEASLPPRGLAAADVAPDAAPDEPNLPAFDPDGLPGLSGNALDPPRIAVSPPPGTASPLSGPPPGVSHAVPDSIVVASFPDDAWQTGPGAGAAQRTEALDAPEFAARETVNGAGDDAPYVDHPAAVLPSPVGMLPPIGASERASVVSANPQKAVDDAFSVAWLERALTKLDEQFDLPAPAAQASLSEPPPQPPPVEPQEYVAAEPEAPPTEAQSEPAALEPAAATRPRQEIAGRYNAGGVSYVMFLDGSIEADTPKGSYSFESLDDLKAFIREKGSIAAT